MAGINDYLNGLGGQEVQEESKILVVKNPNPVVDMLFERYSIWLNEKLHPYYESYSFGVISIGGLVYTSKDIESFLVEMKRLEDHPGFVQSGLFLSVLINACKESDFKVSTVIFDKEIHRIGYINEKNIHIKGNLGSYAFDRMSKGKVLIDGNVRSDFSGTLRGGVLEVNGEIEDNHFFKPLLDDRKSRIYHKGKLIWPEK